MREPPLTDERFVSELDQPLGPALESAFSKGLQEPVEASIGAFDQDIPFKRVPYLLHAGLDYLDKYPYGSGNNLALSGEEAAKACKYLIPRSVKSHLLDTTGNMSGAHLFRYRAGYDPTTWHPHDFYIIGGEEFADFYFVDPEKSMAERCGRPKVTNLVGLRLDKEGDADRFFVSRIFADTIPHKDLKMRLQLGVARSYLTGEPYPALTVNPDSYPFAVHMYADSKRLDVKTRYTPPFFMSDLTNGRCRSPEMRKQLVAAYRVIGQSSQRIPEFKPYKL